MIKDLIAVFKKPTAQAVAADMFHDAQIQVLKHQACADYHAKMAEYHQQTITRLETACSQPSNASSVSHPSRLEVQQSARHFFDTHVLRNPAT